MYGIDLNQECSKHFTLIDFINCSPTFNELKLDYDETPELLPLETDTWSYIKIFAITILDPVVEKFGQTKITFGFCSEALAKEILKRPNPHIAPKLDQHAGFEYNSKGKRICERLGFASDFKTLLIDSNTVASWVIENLNFDRLFYYGKDRPLHVSTSPTPKRQIVAMPEINGKRMPRVIKDISKLDW